MTPGSVARRYAKALYDLTLEDGAVAQTEEALSEFAEAIRQIPAEQLAPGVLGGDARRRFGAALAEQVGPETTFGRFLRVLASNDRLAEIPAVHYWFVKRLDEDAGRVRATVTAAHPLNADQMNAVVTAFAKLAGRKVVPESATDPDLLGGVIVELEGRVYDGSIRTRLARLAARMAGAVR